MPIKHQSIAAVAILLMITTSPALASPVAIQPSVYTAAGFSFGNIFKNAAKMYVTTFAVQAFSYGLASITGTKVVGTFDEGLQKAFADTSKKVNDYIYRSVANSLIGSIMGDDSDLMNDSNGNFNDQFYAASRQNEMNNGGAWTTGTIQRDANGNIIRDADGNPVRNVGGLASSSTQTGVAYNGDPSSLNFRTGATNRANYALVSDPTGGNLQVQVGTNPQYPLKGESYTATMFARVVGRTDISVSGISPRTWQEKPSVAGPIYRQVLVELSNGSVATVVVRVMIDEKATVLTGGSNNNNATLSRAVVVPTASVDNGGNLSPSSPVAPVESVSDVTPTVAQPATTLVADQNENDRIAKSLLSLVTKKQTNQTTPTDVTTSSAVNPIEKGFKAVAGDAIGGWLAKTVTNTGGIIGDKIYPSSGGLSIGTINVTKSDNGSKTTTLADVMQQTATGNAATPTPKTDTESEWSAANQVDARALLGAKDIPNGGRYSGAVDSVSTKTYENRGITF